MENMYNALKAKTHVVNEEGRVYFATHLRDSLNYVNLQIDLGNGKEAQEEIMDMANLLSRFGL